MFLFDGIDGIDGIYVSQLSVLLLVGFAVSYFFVLRKLRLTHSQANKTIKHTHTASDQENMPHSIWHGGVRAARFS